MCLFHHWFLKLDHVDCMRKTSTIPSKDRTKLYHQSCPKVFCWTEICAPGFSSIFAKSSIFSSPVIQPCTASFLPSKQMMGHWHGYAVDMYMGRDQKAKRITGMAGKRHRKQGKSSKLAMLLDFLPSQSRLLPRKVHHHGARRRNCPPLQPLQWLRSCGQMDYLHHLHPLRHTSDSQHWW